MAAVTQRPVSPPWKPHLLMSWLSIFNHTGQLSDDSLKERGEKTARISFTALKLNYEAVRSKLPAGLEFYPLVRLRVLTHLLSKHSEEIKTLPSCTYTAHLIFWMVFWGTALRGLPTGTRWPCNACVPLLYCLYRNVIGTDCLKSLTTSTTSSAHGGLQHAFYPRGGGGVQASAFTHENDQHLQIRNRAIKKNRKAKSCVFIAENLVGKPLINQSYLDNKLTNVVACQREAVSLSKYNIYIKNWGWDGVNYSRNTSQLCYQLRWEILTPRRVCCSDFASLASGCMFDTWNRFAQLEEPAIHFSVSQRC